MSTSTKTKILDTAEHFFANHGYAGTSLRQIIAEAGVNLAAVHYHFGSKEELLSAVILRKAAPINAERLRLLDEAESRGEPAVEDILRAFLAPAFHMAHTNPEVGCLMGRLFAETEVLPSLIRRNFGTVIARFTGALASALPHLSQEELAWRIHFTIGAMAHSLRLPPVTLPGVQQYAPVAACERLVVFVGAAMRSPALEEISK